MQAGQPVARPSHLKPILRQASRLTARRSPAWITAPSTASASGQINSVTETDGDDYNWAESAGTTTPDAPTSLAIESGNRQLTLSWEKPSNLGSVSITGYVVQYRKTSETNWTTSTAANRESTDSQTSVTTYSNTITGLDYSTDYDLRVRADNDCYACRMRTTTTGRIATSQTIPDSPGNLEVTPGNEKLTLTWQAPAASGSISINGYAVQYKKTADANWTPLTALTPGTLGTTIGSLDNDVPYSVRVRATNLAVLDDGDDYNWASGSGTPVPDPSISIGHRGCEQHNSDGRDRNRHIGPH